MVYASAMGAFVMGIVSVSDKGSGAHKGLVVYVVAVDARVEGFESAPKAWSRYRCCYCLSKWMNCFHGTCSGLVTWQPRYTADALSGTRHVVSTLPLPLIASVVVLLNGGASPMTPALSMTHASVPVSVPFPQLSPHVRSYHPITPSPCALG